MSTDNPYQAPAIEPNEYTLSHKEEMALLEADIGRREPFSVIDLFFSFQGRTGRLGYWIVTISAKLAQIFTMIGFFVYAESQLGGVDTGLARIIAWIVYLPFLVAMLSVEVKRWHDRGKSGWWSLLNFLPGIGQLWIFIECGCLPGDYGPNHYGEYPSV